MAVANWEFQSCIRGYHVYRSIWTPTLGDIHPCVRETTNRHDPFAVKVLETGTIVGHLPKKISSACSLFLRRGGIISCRVTGEKRYSRDLIQGGLEIPCVLLIEGNAELLTKLKRLLLFSETADEETNCEENPPKKIKLESEEEEMDVESCNTGINGESLQWVFFGSSNITLYMDDKSIIENGLKLNDKHINCVQSLLNLQFPNTEGLKCTLIQTRIKLDITKDIVQIVHCRGNHWVVISNLLCGAGKIHVYDTVYSNVDDQTRKVIDNMFEGKVVIDVFESVQKQQGNKTVASSVLL